MGHVFSIIFILVGLLNVVSPESMMRYQDLTRIKGEREYTSFALVMRRIGGFVGMIIGIVLFFSLE